MCLCYYLRLLCNKIKSNNWKTALTEHLPWSMRFAVFLVFAWTNLVFGVIIYHLHSILQLVLLPMFLFQTCSLLIVCHKDLFCWSLLFYMFCCLSLSLHKCALVSCTLSVHQWCCWQSRWGCHPLWLSCSGIVNKLRGWERTKHRCRSKRIICIGYG